MTDFPKIKTSDIMEIEIPDLVVTNGLLHEAAVQMFRRV